MVVGAGGGQYRVAGQTVQPVTPCVRQFGVGDLYRVGQEECRVEMQVNLNDTVAPVYGVEGVDNGVVLIVVFPLVADGCSVRTACVHMAVDRVFRSRPYRQFDREDGVHFLFAGCPYGIYVGAAAP